MGLTNQELLEKATTTTNDFGSTGTAALSVQQATDFISLLAANQVFLPDVRTVQSRAAKWQEALLDFGGRITYPGVEGTRLADQNRAKPKTMMVEISTKLQRSEVPVSDEVMEDNIANQNFGNELENLIADQVGYDIEELMVGGDTAVAGTDPYLGQLDGWLKQAQGTGGHVLNAASLAQDYQTIFKTLLNSLPNRFKRNLAANFRYYVPVVLEEIYRDILSSRGTNLGDVMLTSGGSLSYQGIPIIGAPSIKVTAGTPDTSFILLANRNNLLAGFRRNITIESFRDPREGATSFLCTTRVDAKIGVVDATAVATNVNVEP